MPAGNGFTDDQGVWQYGENDAQALASDLLNLGQASVSDQFTADRTRLGNLEAIRPGMLKIRPATAAAAGVGATATIAADRTVQVAGAATAVSLNGLFDGTFENYKLYATIRGTANGIVTVRLRKAGADDSSANYSYQGFGMSAAASSGGGPAGQAGWAATNQGMQNQDIELDILGPAIAAATRYKSSYYQEAGATQMVGLMGGKHALASAFDGISLILSSGTFTGSLRCVGMN